jgi:hypothetical protein
MRHHVFPRIFRIINVRMSSAPRDPSLGGDWTADRAHGAATHQVTGEVVKNWLTKGYAQAIVWIAPAGGCCDCERHSSGAKLATLGFFSKPSAMSLFVR